jgi:hypothetical protein
MLAGKRRRRVDELVSGGSDGTGADRTDPRARHRLALLDRLAKRTRRFQPA